MPRREAVVPPPSVDVQQFVERVAVGQPRRAFLIGAEQVAAPLKCIPTGKRMPVRRSSRFLKSGDTRMIVPYSPFTS